MVVALLRNSRRHGGSCGGAGGGGGGGGGGRRPSSHGRRRSLGTEHVATCNGTTTRTVNQLPNLTRLDEFIAQPLKTSLISRNNNSLALLMFVWHKSTQQ